MADTGKTETWVRMPPRPCSPPPFSAALPSAPSPPQPSGPHQRVQFQVSTVPAGSSRACSSRGKVSPHGREIWVQGHSAGGTHVPLCSSWGSAVSGYNQTHFSPCTPARSRYGGQDTASGCTCCPGQPQPSWQGSCSQRAPGCRCEQRRGHVEAQALSTWPGRQSGGRARTVRWSPGEGTASHSFPCPGECTPAGTGGLSSTRGKGGYPPPQVLTRAGLQVTFLPLLCVPGLAWYPRRTLLTAPMSLHSAPATGSRAAAPRRPGPTDRALVVWAHQGPVDTGAVNRGPGHESRGTEPLLPSNAHNPHLPQASYLKLPSAPHRPPVGSHTSFCSPAVPPRLGPPPMRHWGWEGHSGRRRWAHSAHPVSVGQVGSGSLGGVGRTSRIRFSAGTHKGSLWQPDGVQSLRLTLEPPPLTSTPSPHLTWSPCCFHRWSTGRGRCSPPCVGTTPGTLEAA